MNIDLPSFQSLYVEPRFNEQGLSHATGFIVERPDGSPMLITNWHVVTGRDINTRKVISNSGGIPNALRIQHNVEGRLGTWMSVIEPLRGPADEPLWLEDPTNGSKCDVVGLPLTNLGDVARCPHSYSGPVSFENLQGPLRWGPSDSVNVIGFPFGKSGGGGLGIWVRGSIATEPDLDFEDLPRFLIDSRTRPGQSGSPVVFYKRGGTVALQNKSRQALTHPLVLLVGVYSGRLNSESDLGTVWKTSVVAAIAERGKPGTAE